MPPILTIAGSDSSAGAGIQADLKSISANDGYGLCAVTAVVSEMPGRVSRIALMEASLIEDQVRVLAGGFPIAAAKTGMLGGLDQVRAVVRVWQDTLHQRVPLVVDPVMVATSGDPLIHEQAIDLMQRELLPMATLITPNMDEARVLWGKAVTTRSEMQDCASDLAKRFHTAVLVKGGHLVSEAAADCLIDSAGNLTWLETPRVTGVSTHGTGCSYSAAIATGLGKGLSLHDAVREAKSFIARAIRFHHVWAGSHGPVHALHHFAPLSA